MTETVVFFGYGRMPQGTPLYEINKAIAIGIEVDIKTKKIIDVDATFLSDLSKRTIRDILVGLRIDGESEIRKAIEKRYIGLGQKAIICAIIDAHGRYEMYMNKRQ